ncbi:MAG: AAA family ATPase [Alphaproteobacteria bacterium]|nr:AAA family ATPase [Alphaproteobacteria bacterium]MBN2675193.1 AAA family ATPase [Alphaproteobacteria bacterium]
MSLIAPILNDSQLAAFDSIEHSNNNMLILGQAGTGKSTFVNYLKSASKKRIICACPTAVSALNISGQTIHSLFQIQPRDFIMPEFLKLKAKPRNILFAADMLIIDEISMVSPDLLDAMDILARQARRNNEPFGGLQVIAIGDLFQLPPVITNDAKQYYQQAYEHSNAYFFDSNVYKRANFQKTNFDLVYRQNDMELLGNLVRLRNNETAALEFFNKCKIEDDVQRSNAVIITPFRAVAERINADRLSKIDAPEVNYTGTLNGNFSEKDIPAPMNLTLKIGALVVFVKNSDKWHNGSMGIVRELGIKEIRVQLLGGTRDIVTVKQDKWEKIEYSHDENNKLVENEIGSYKQFPLNLGYAMTIHKAQGKTLDTVVVDISRGAFTHGQTYVALSRTRKSSDMHIENPLRQSDIIFDSRVLEFVSL